MPRNRKGASYKHIGVVSMNAKDLLKKALADIGADGLCNPVADCGCGLDDFEPCLVCNLDECVPAVIGEGELFYAIREDSQSKK